MPYGNNVPKVRRSFDLSPEVGLMAIGLIAIVSCSGAVASPDPATPTTAGIANVTTAADASTTSSTPDSTTTTRPIAALGLVTPTGVPVAILRSLPVGYVVLTPCGNVLLMRKGKAIGKTTVVIDPGHGGSVDTGAVAPTGMPEKTLNLKVAEAVADALEDRSIAAVLTRTADYASPLSVRAQLADTLDAELMVSIHHNAPSPGPSPVPGIEVFIQNGSSSSKRLGGLLWQRAMAALDVFDVDWVAEDDAGVMTVLNSRGDDAYGIIRHPETPTAIVELGYISNRAEADLYQDPTYLAAAAGGISQAIQDFLNSDNEGSGFIEGRVFDPQPGVGKDVCTDPDLGR
jgi:N-acetylmuramoyl-L-alanine amidase